MYLFDKLTNAVVGWKASSGAAHVVDQTLRAGENQNSARLDVFNGGVGVTVVATGVVRALPCGIYRIRCLTAGTITSLHDNASAASGTQILGSTAMTPASPPIEIGEYLDYGLWAVIASGTYRIVFTPTF